MPTRIEKKKKLIEQLAHFLADNQGGKSVLLQVESQRPESDPRPAMSKEWALLCQAAGLQGWTTFEETVEKLNELLG